MHPRQIGNYINKDGSPRKCYYCGTEWNKSIVCCQSLKIDTSRKIFEEDFQEQKEIIHGKDCPIIENPFSRQVPSYGCKLKVEDAYCQCCGFTIGMLLGKNWMKFPRFMMASLFDDIDEIRDVLWKETLYTCAYCVGKEKEECGGNDYSRFDIGAFNNFYKSYIGCINARRHLRTKRMNEYSGFIPRWQNRKTL